MSQETIEKTFNVDTQPRLTLSNIRGSVEIHPGDDRTIQVTALMHLNSGDSERTKITFAQVDTNLVSARTDFRDGWFGLPKNKPCKVEYSVQVPQECSLKVSGISSSTTIQGVEGEIDIKSVSGRITLKDISGPLKIDSISANTFGERAVGSLDFNTISGKIRFIESQFTCIDGQTVSGNISLQTPLVKGPFQFVSVSGDVVLIVPVDTACTVVLKSLSGRLNTTLPSTSSHIRDGNRRLEILGGGIEIGSKSISGSLFLKTNKDFVVEEECVSGLLHSVERSSAPEISNATSTKSYMELLERITNGELSVDEAVEIIS